ncbi:hypothetical protein CDL15_Pgr010058 [Punica granatum]|uniref:Uncharacterized protein n=1 Tax=Punica granatum TaxID=22663 RepID=A0A218X5Y3_PUNGR|nr:hypothetical protein CDL15_Pgr010058 [Punica granatum]
MFQAGESVGTTTEQLYAVLSFPQLNRSYSSLPKHCLNSFPKEVAQVRPIRGWSHIVAVGSVSPALRRGSADGTPSYRSWVRSWGCRPALT